MFLVITFFILLSCYVATNEKIEADYKQGYFIVVLILIALYLIFGVWL